MMGRINLLPLVLSMLGYAFAVNLYGVVTGFPADYLEVYSITIQSNGQWTRTVDNFVYLTDESVTYDGISGFDYDEKILYYCTDYDSAFIFRADMTTKCLYPPISLDASAIESMKYDTIKKRMLITFEDAKGNLVVVQYSTQGKGYGIVQTLTAYHGDWLDAALDVTKQMYYFVGHNTSGNFIGGFSIATTNAPVFSAYINCGVASVFPEFLTFDPIRKVLVGTMSSFVPSLHYYYITINPTNYQCKATLIKTQEFGIATCFSYHPTSHTLYMGWAPNGPGKVYTVDVVAGTTKGVALNPSNVLSDIFVDPLS